MNEAVIPALVAAGGGSSLMAAITIYERRRDAEMRSSRRAYAATFPAGLTPEAAVAALGGLSGLTSQVEVVSEVVADEDGIRHLLHLPERVAESARASLCGAMPGLRLEPVEVRPTGAATVAVRIRVPTGTLLRTDGSDAASVSLLSGLAALRDDERVSLRWALRPGGPAPLPDDALATTPAARVVERARRARVGEPTLHVAGLLLVRAGTVARAMALARHVSGVLRGRQSVGRGLNLRYGRGSKPASPRSHWRRGWLSVREVVGLLGWPLGSTAVPGLEVGAARRLHVPKTVARAGRQLLVGHDARGERPVALTPEAARHHAAVVGPAGTGKSVLLARGVLDDLAHGFGGFLLDPKADLVDSVLDRVRPRDADRVVVLNPATPGPVPGLDLLGVGDPDLRSDVVLGALGAIFKDSWGVRTDTYLRLGLRSLAELPAPVLTDWLRLFTDAGFRRVTVAQLSDPLLTAAWASYEELSSAEKHQHVAAPMSKVMSLLSRPAVRNVLAQTQPRLDLPRLLAERRWLMVSLSPGTLGEPTARLLGSILTYAVWAAIEERAALPPAERHPVFLYLDELQSLATLPFGIEYLFERSRGLGCGVTVATQALGRLPEAMRQSLLGNVGTLVSYRLGYEEAVRVSRELPGLAASDLQALKPFEVAARVSTGLGSGTAVITGHTEPLGPTAGQAERIRQTSAERYGGVADLGTERPPTATKTPYGRHGRAS